MARSLIRARRAHIVWQPRTRCQDLRARFHAPAPTLVAMANESAPQRKPLEDQARRLLERAREESGASVEEMVQILGELQPRRAETRRSWYDWQERPETVSLLTGLAAIHMLGREATIELLFTDTAPNDAREPKNGPDDNLAYLRHALGSLVAEMADMRERIEGFVVPELQKQGALMTNILADMRDAGIVPTARTREQMRSEGIDPSTADTPSAKEAS